MGYPVHRNHTKTGRSHTRAGKHTPPVKDVSTSNRYTKTGVALPPPEMSSMTQGRDPRLVPPGIGHNGGPPLYRKHGWALTCWRKAQEKAWATPPIEVVRRRCRRARELGMTYREYTLEILERGRYL